MKGLIKIGKISKKKLPLKKTYLLTSSFTKNIPKS